MTCAPSLGLQHGATGQACPQTCQGLAGLHQLFNELIAALQHLCQLLQLELHLVAVLLIHRVHVLLHLLTQLSHLEHGGKGDGEMEMGTG